MHIFTFQDPAALSVNQLALLVNNLIIVQKVLSDCKVIGLQLFLSLFNSIIQHFMLKSHPVIMRDCFEYSHCTIRAIKF